MDLNSWTVKFGLYRKMALHDGKNLPSGHVRGVQMPVLLSPTRGCSTESMAEICVKTSHRDSPRPHYRALAVRAVSAF